MTLSVLFTVLVDRFSSGGKQI